MRGWQLCARGADGELLAVRHCCSTRHTDHPAHTSSWGCTPCTGHPVQEAAVLHCCSCSAKPDMLISAPFRMRAKKKNPTHSIWSENVPRGKECFQISKRRKQTIWTTEMHIKVKPCCLSDFSFFFNANLQKNMANKADLQDWFLTWYVIFPLLVLWLSQGRKKHSLWLLFISMTKQNIKREASKTVSVGMYVPANNFYPEER